MQHKFTKSLLATAILFGLTACGSSGGGGSSSEPTTKVNTTLDTAIKNTANSSSGAKGGMYTVSVDSQGNPFVTVKTLYSEKVENIGLDTIALKDAKELENEINKRIQLDGIENINTVGYSGLLMGDNKLYAFYTGSPTENMPTSGKIEYRGHSFLFDLFEDYSSDYYTNEVFDRMMGEAQFTVDLSTKKLTGRLTQSNFQPVTVNADISGNSFIGKATANYIDTTVEGKFYGDKAIGLAGILKTDNHILRDEDSDMNGIVGAFYGYDTQRTVRSGCISTNSGQGCYSYGR